MPALLGEGEEMKTKECNDLKARSDEVKDKKKPDSKNKMRESKNKQKEAPA